MPYYNSRYKYSSYKKKGYYNKSGKRRKNIFYRRSYNKGVYLAKKALSMLNVEYKHIDTTVSVSPTTSGAITQLSVIAQGDTEGTRDGRSVKLKSLSGRLSFTLDSMATETRLRCIIFKKINVNLIAPVVADILTNVNIQGLRNLNNTKNIKIYYDKTFDMNTNERKEKGMKCFFKLNSKQIYETANAGGDATDLERNGIYMMTLSDEAMNAPTVSGYFRLRYIDN